MVWHTVWFKLKEGTSDAQKQDMLDALDALPDAIEAIGTLACGEDFAGRAQGYDIGLVVSFSSRAELEIYSPHPYHQNFIAKFKPLWDGVLALDFEA